MRRCIQTIDWFCRYTHRYVTPTPTQNTYPQRDLMLFAGSNVFLWAVCVWETWMNKVCVCVSAILCTHGSNTSQSSSYEASAGMVAGTSTYPTSGTVSGAGGEKERVCVWGKTPCKTNSIIMVWALHYTCETHSIIMVRALHYFIISNVIATLGEDHTEQLSQR